MKTYSKQEIEYLSEFVQHVDSLSQCRFASKILSNEALTLRKIDDGPLHFVDVDEDDCRSFLLGVRLLVQDRDGISLRKIWDILACVDDLDLLKTVNQARAPVFLALDSPAMFADPKGNSITNQEVFDTFMYGGYAHRDKAHSKKFKEWEASEQFMSLKLIFLMSVRGLYEGCMDMAQVARDILRKQSANVV